MLNKLIGAGKILLGVVTAGVGVIATITGAVTALGAMGGEESGKSEATSTEE